jgi:putative FmdB family regulatory protein
VPSYDYRCSNCGCTFDVYAASMTSSTAEPAPTCPRCASRDSRRVVSRVAILKGSSPGMGASAYPTSWAATNHGDPDSINYWRRRVEKEKSQEARDPGLSHERFLNAERRYTELSQRRVPDGPPVESAGIAHGPDAGHTHEHDVAGGAPRDHGHGHDHGHVPGEQAPQERRTP